MIETTITMKAIQKKRVELMQTLLSITKQIVKEKGCKICQFVQDVENENILRLIEEWETQEELDSHLRSDLCFTCK